jgi:hypothetical protein
VNALVSALGVWTVIGKATAAAAGNRGLPPPHAHSAAAAAAATAKTLTATTYRCMKMRERKRGEEREEATTGTVRTRQAEQHLLFLVSPDMQRVRPCSTPTKESP